MKKAVVGWIVLMCAAVLAAPLLPDPDFKVEIQEVKILTPVVRPGEPLLVDMTFRALSGRPSVEYRGFLHLEREITKPDICTTNMAITDFGIDWWQDGGETYHGVYSINVPPSCPEGTRVLHVGFYIDVQNFMVEDTFTFQVDKNAPDSRPVPPPPLGKAERGRRQALLSNFAAASIARLENNNFRFEVSALGQWKLTDKTTGTDWTSNPDSPRLGIAAFVSDGRKSIVPITNLELVRQTDKSFVMRFAAPDGLGDLEFTAEMKDGDDRAIHISWKQTGGRGKLANVIFPEKSFGATGEENGIALIPNAMGVLMYADENMPTSMSFLPYNSYGGLYMLFGGMVRGNGGILFYWNDVDASLGVRRQWNPPNLPGSTALDLSLAHPGEGDVTIVNAGTSDYAKVAGAYREAAREKGYLKTFREKFGNGPNPIDGRVMYRMDCAMHYVPHTRYNPTDKEIRILSYTFDEVATSAEYLHDRLGLKNGLIIFAGWGNCGYDFHPDVLPANPEAGGDEGLRDASDRIRALGYLVGGHDNYQDIYETAPSWNEDDIIRDEDGSLHKGGVWAHGQCYIASTGAMLKNAKRNIPEIKKRYGFNFHLIDTVFAVPLIPDYNPKCPATRYDDMRGKQRLCQYVRDEIGLLGSEEGIEWAVPVADYFDSLFGQRVNCRSTDVVVPLFEMVFGDCISIYQGNRTTVTMPNAVLDHILCAEMPSMMFPAYDGTDYSVNITDVEKLEGNAIRIHYLPTAANGPLPETAKFIFHLGNPGMNNGRESAVAGADIMLKADDWNHAQSVDIALPENGGDRYEVLCMMIRRYQRLMMTNLAELAHHRYLVCSIQTNGDSVEMLPPQPPPESCFARLDSRPDVSYANGGMLINLSTIIGDIMERTRNHPMTAHRFLTADRMVEQSEFGPVKITVNHGDVPFDTGRFVLPKWGFAAEAPGFTAFRADAADGTVFSETTMLSRTRERTFFAYGDKNAE